MKDFISLSNMMFIYWGCFNRLSRLTAVASLVSISPSTSSAVPAIDQSSHLTGTFHTIITCQVSRFSTLVSAPSQATPLSSLPPPMPFGANGISGFPFVNTISYRLTESTLDRHQANPRNAIRI
ncbi:hypothetical protein QCA50_014861 [Cerrena zonata]|uniref:Uncharacterized protein n=1 Tax=Cerrena zonata TaxID=2478898 RepID=A0AAW0FQQ2_9APHY